MEKSPRRAFSASLISAMKSLAAARAYTAVMLTTLAIGIAGSLAIGSIAAALSLRGDAYSSPDELVELFAGDPNSCAECVDVFSDAESRQWAPGWTGVLEGVSLFRSATVSLRGDTAAIPAALVSGNLFDVIGSRPTMGRALQAGDDNSGAAAVISYSLWRGRFNRDPAILGKNLHMEGWSDARIVGVIVASSFVPVSTG